MSSIYQLYTRLPYLSHNFSSTGLINPSAYANSVVNPSYAPLMLQGTAARDIPYFLRYRNTPAWMRSAEMSGIGMLQKGIEALTPSDSKKSAGERTAESKNMPWNEANAQSLTLLANASTLYNFLNPHYMTKDEIRQNRRAQFGGLLD
jgi:hypothetical protein